MTTWQRAEHDPIAHGFSEAAWMRSLCGELRWTVALLDGSGHRRCPSCLLLETSVSVVPVRDARAGQLAARTRRSAIAEATAKRRWRRTS